MIEIIYNKEKEKATGNEEYFCVPRNIRQIGEVPKDSKIYLEDYVHTYLTADWKEEEPKGKIAILLGKYNWKNGVAYIFIKSAVSVDNVSITRDNCSLSDSAWGTIYEDMKKYFPGQEVVGWYLSMPDEGLRINDAIVRTHLKHFGGNDKVLFLADPYERENAFYLYRNNHMEQQNGYYIFYEKNDLMQEYMLMRNPEEPTDFSGKVQDRAVKDFRKKIANKQKEKEADDSGISWGAVACMGIVALSLAVGAAWVSAKGAEEEQAKAARASEVSSNNIEGTDTEDVNIEGMQIDEEVTPEDGMVLLTPEVTATPASMDDQAEAEGSSENISQENQLSADQVSEENLDTADQQTSISVYTKYTVRNGDTLSKISLRYYGDFSKISEICKINNLLAEDVIYPGQTILLP